MAVALEMTGVGKTYGAVRALTDVDLSVHTGEVHCVLGENGAGKSTLCNLVYGGATLDEGRMRLFGDDYRPRRPADALRHGIAMVHQHFSLVPELTVAENLALGEGSWLRVPRRELLERAAALGEEFRLPVDLTARAGTLSVGERQRVEIVKCLMRDPRLVLLDEPTAVLGPAEIAALLDTCRRIAESGRAVVLVTHKLGEIEQVGDRATVLRGGRVTGAGPLSDFGRDELVELMIGRAAGELDQALTTGVAAARTTRAPITAEPVLRVRNLRSARPAGGAALDGLDLDLRPGEITGIAGVEGNCQTELVAVLSGALRPESGTVDIGGADLTHAPPARRTAAGLGVIPEDRHHEGCVPAMSVADNLYLGRLADFRRRGLLDRKAMNTAAARVIDDHDIKASGPRAPMSTLSGGNQQKVVVARELAIDPLRCLVAAHPTRGLDLGAVDAVLQRLRAAAESGAAVLVVSHEVAELLSVCDRVLVAYRGQLRGPVDPADPRATEQIAHLMLGTAS
ncbi:ABC transporter ATP-binding protein [Nocardia sp.]|uniref:ABC transporter ATP-binding protein n=1 Tax=Nocardia sp. TaxID=1821 RepID=UPI0025833CB6|nr:ABC transporter ATP-binding protein [Nocardia sp.]